MNAKNERSDGRLAGAPGRGRPRRLPVAHAAVALLIVLAALCVAATLLALLAAPLAAQAPAPTETAAPVTGPAPIRLWAAQTGPDQLSLTWDSIEGTNEYLVYGVPADDLVGNLRLRPPLQRLGGRSRSATVFGLRRLAGGVTLVAMAANGHVIQKAQFNPVRRATSFAVIQPPAEVTAEATGPEEITLSWTPVPGATAYYIGRAVAPGGFGTLCAVCSTEPRYVDHDVTPGARTSYSVAAIFPTGKSRPAPSNELTPGVTQLASTGAPQTAPTTYTKTAPGTTLSSATPTTTTFRTTASYDSTTHITTYVDETTTCTTVAPITCTTSQSTRLVYTPPPTTTSTTTTTSPTTTPTPSTTPTTSATPAPDTATATSSGPIGAALNVVSGAIGTLTGAVKPPASVSAVSPAPAAVRLTWQASPTTGVTAYEVSRRVNGGTGQLLATLGPSVSSYSDTFFPVTMFASGAAWVSYSVVALQNNVRSSAATTGTLSVQPPAPTPTTSPAGSTATATACKLDYQRADNMWAAFGRPDGFLGTETISLAAGQDKVFITDWAYEKQRNDGTNYYGSHLRIATNRSARAIRLQLRVLTSTSWIRLDAGKTQSFQADLMEVFCEN